MRPGRAALALLGLAAGAGWEAQRRIDRARLAADPERARLEAPLAGRRLAAVSDDGTALHVEEFGPEDAPTVVLVHGWTCALRFWTRQVQDLSRDHRVVAFDLRGHGRSAAPPNGDYSTEAFAGDLDAVLRNCLHPGERAVVAGHSLGAMIMVAWAGRRPELVARRLAGAALVNTGLGDLVAESLVVRRPSRLDAVRRSLVRAAMSAKAPIPKGSTPVSARLIHRLTLGPEATPAQVAFCERMVLECRREARAACGATLSRLELSESVESLAVPTVVVAGARDRMTPPAHSRRLARELPQLVAHIELPAVGHMAPVEAPEAVSRELRQLVRRTLRPAPARAAAARSARPGRDPADSPPAASIA